ncbi:MAG: DUF3108 domain-containing protein [Bryobacteraceae bacterium]|nr:DUF3108 domain-containing protein [Bryobacteraceae bacterium]
MSPMAPAEVVEGSSSSAYTLHYGVEWRLVRAGFAKVTWSPRAGGYQADMHMESAGLVNKLYRVNDDYQARVDSTLCGNSVLFNAEEGKRRRETKLTFDPHAGAVHYVERDLVKNATILTHEVNVPPCTHEYLGALHKIRGLKLEPGQSTTVHVSDGKKFADVRVEAQEREQIRIPLGTFNTIRYEIFLFNDVIIPKKARMFLWVSDDARKLPVQLRVRMQFLIGNITLQLEKEERL